jgi:outer membrane protein OmpA-like peptidoglycan-associated protein
MKTMAKMAAGVLAVSGIAVAAPADAGVSVGVGIGVPAGPAYGPPPCAPYYCGYPGYYGPRPGYWGWRRPGWRYSRWAYPGWAYPGWGYPGWTYPASPYPGWGYGGWRQRRPAPSAPAPGAPVQKACTLEIHGINFDFDQSYIRKDSEPVLKQVLALFTNDPHYSAEISGHTDSAGTGPYNMKLSERRAQAVKAWLVAHGVAASRIITAGYGDTRPLVPNTTDENRARNRRVELKQARCNG